MKWNYISKETNNHYKNWHTWFAWYPIEIFNNGNVDKVWLENVVRMQRGNRNYSFLERLFGKPHYNYGSSILDVIKNDCPKGDCDCDEKCVGC